jgi:transcriptional regulator with XRE-family HTH domain
VCQSGPKGCTSVTGADVSTEDQIEQEHYGRVVGGRLRQIRKQKNLSLQEVESISDHEFKASVLGAYERGERSISVPRLHRLARFYRVPVDQLLPGDDGEAPEPGERDQSPTKSRIDLAKLDELDDPDAEMLARYLRMIQVQRQDFNGRVLTIRRDDMRAIACMLGVSEDQAGGRLEELGLG